MAFLVCSSLLLLSLGGAATIAATSLNLKEVNLRHEIPSSLLWRIILEDRNYCHWPIASIIIIIVILMNYDQKITRRDP